MSDFDKEAERERLREKYERDQEKRKSTERMSELLLKGATMTDTHCADCGDPIFRYDGEEFCPTCQEVITDDESGDAEGESGAADGESGAQSAEAEPKSTGDGETPGEAGTDASPASGTDASPAPGAGTTPESAPGTNGANAGATGPRPDAPASNDPREDASTGRATRDRSTGSSARSAAPDQGDAPSRSTPSGDAEGLAAARDSLTRTLLAQARAAEECEDPRQAKTHLAAAREAAETISVLPSY